MVTTLTAKGQITLPAAARRQLGLKPGAKLEVLVTEDGRLEVIPLCESVRALKGMVPKPAKPLSMEDMAQVGAPPEDLELLQKREDQIDARAAQAALDELGKVPGTTWEEFRKELGL